MTILLSGCLRPSGTKPRGSNMVEVFYKGEGKMLYFVRPLHLEAEDVEMRLDFSYNFTVTDSLQDSVVANFSIFDDVKHTVTSVHFHESGPVAVRPMFHEKKRKYVVSRYSATVPYAIFESFILAEAPVVSVATSEETLTFSPDKWEKYSHKTKEELVDVVRFYFN